MRNASSPILVEFVGVPGSGKSEISHRVAKVLRSSGRYPFSEPTHLINSRLPPPLRLVAKLPYAGYGALQELKLLDRFVNRAKVSSLNPALLFNWLFVRGAVEWTLIRNQAATLDQGLIQALWSFRLSEADDTVALLRRRLLEVYPKMNSLIVCVEVSLDAARSRLASRSNNQSRVGTSPATSFDVKESWDAYRYTREIVRRIVDSRPGATMLRIQNEDQADLAANIETVVSGVETRI